MLALFFLLAIAHADRFDKAIEEFDQTHPAKSQSTTRGAKPASSPGAEKVAEGTAVEDATILSNTAMDLPLVETPFNFVDDGYTFPSMRQSLALSTDYYEGLHWAIVGPREQRNVVRVLLVFAADFISDWLPLGNGWMHEEWHRAVMSRRHIGSYNDIYNFPVGASTLAVSHVTDADLIALKRDHPTDQIRLSAAGMESQVAQNLLIAKHHFFNGARTFDASTLWLNTINTFSYLSLCASHQADTETDDANEDDGRDVKKRDFTGLDCTGWVYDLFRPQEPYAARGPHPSGVGIDRYIKYSDLTHSERSFLNLQSYLTVLNFANPFLLGYESFHAHVFDRDVRWNATMSHYLTSFGYTVDANLFLDVEDKKLLVQLHNGSNHANYFPGVTVERYQQSLPWPQLKLNTQLTLWRQPHHQRVDSVSADWLLAGGAQVFYHRQENSNFVPYIGVEAKTPGWLAGNVYVEKNITFWTGLTAALF